MHSLPLSLPMEKTIPINGLLNRIELGRVKLNKVLLFFIDSASGCFVNLYHQIFKQPDPDSSNKLLADPEYKHLFFSNYIFIVQAVGFDMAKTAADRLYSKTGVKPTDVDVVELHDCFSANELITYEALGLCEVGKAGEFIDRGQPLRLFDHSCF